MSQRRSKEEFSWPDYFPEGCPPEEASLTDGIVIRLVRSERVTAADFVPHRLLYPKIDDWEDVCEACGLSVYRTVDEAVRLSKIVPRFRDYKPAAGELDSSLGVMNHTPRKGDTHHTWWLPLDADPAPRFSMVATAGGGDSSVEP